jgi:CheY-like chemotaxis protein
VEEPAKPVPRRNDSPVRVILISWSPDTASAVEHLRPLAEEVDVRAPEGPAHLTALAEDPPEAVVIDLGRRPSDGVALAVELRRTPETRDIPQVFAGADPDEIERVRQVLPDARYSDWDGIATQLRTALERPPEDPVAPERG